MENETDFEEFVADALHAYADESGDDVRIRSFDEAGLLGTNAGLVVKIGGVEYQMTIVRSK